MAKFSVPFPDGQISVSVNGDPPKTYTVKGGQIDAPEQVAAAFDSTVSGGLNVSSGTPTVPTADTGTPGKE